MANKFTCVLNVLGEDEAFSVTSFEKQETYTAMHEINIKVGNDGAVTLSEVGGDGFIYLYPAQVKHLLYALRQAGKMAKVRGAKP